MSVNLSSATYAELYISYCKDTVFCEVTTCSLVEPYVLFGTTNCLHLLTLWASRYFPWYMPKARR